MLSTLGLVAALSSMRTPGTTMPAGTLPSLRGPSVSLRAPAGKPSVVVIFADWCDPCHADMPSINASAKRNPSVRFLGVDELESAAHARAFVAATRTPFETVLVTNEAFSKPDVTDEQRGATGLDIPAVYVLDGRGVVVKAFVGGDPQVGTKIDAALSALSASAHPRIFAPGVISTTADEAGGALSPDGKDFYFVEFSPYTIAPRLGLMCVSHFANGAWQTPEALPFSGTTLDYPPHLSPDGTRMYFASFRRSPTSAARTIRIWTSQKTGDTWGAPEPLPAPINADDSYNADASVTNDGTLYFSSTRGDPRGHFHIFRSVFRDGAYQMPEKIGDAINSPYNDLEPFVSPDERTLVFASVGTYDVAPGKRVEELIAGGNPYPREDLYVSQRVDGVWSTARHLGDGVNTFAADAYPSISPDGRTLFFSSERSPFDVPMTRRVDATAFVRDVDSLENGRGNIYSVDIAALGLAP